MDSRKLVETRLEVQLQSPPADLQSRSEVREDVNRDCKHVGRVWRMGCTHDAGPGAIIISAADVWQRCSVESSGPSTIPRITVGTGRGGHTSTLAAASCGIRRIVHRAHAMAIAVWSAH